MLVINTNTTAVVHSATKYVRKYSESIRLSFLTTNIDRNIIITTLQEKKLRLEQIKRLPKSHPIRKQDNWDISKNLIEFVPIYLQQAVALFFFLIL